MANQRRRYLYTVVRIDNGVLSPIIDNPPKLLDAINKHGLAIFLIVSHHEWVPMFARLRGSTRKAIEVGVLLRSKKLTFSRNHRLRSGCHHLMYRRPSKIFQAGMQMDLDRHFHRGPDVRKNHGSLT